MCVYSVCVCVYVYVYVGVYVCDVLCLCHMSSFPANQVIDPLPAIDHSEVGAYVQYLFCG